LKSVARPVRFDFHGHEINGGVTRSELKFKSMSGDPIRTAFFNKKECIVSAFLHGNRGAQPGYGHSFSLGISVFQ
jgi:hypothetical protein